MYCTTVVGPPVKPACPQIDWAHDLTDGRLLMFCPLLLYTVT